MTSKAIRRWTCDNCGREEEVQESPVVAISLCAPEGWLNEGGSLGTLCPACVEVMRAALATCARVEVQPPAGQCSYPSTQCYGVFGAHDPHCPLYDPLDIQEARR